MARNIETHVNKTLFANIETIFEDGSPSLKKRLKVGDVVENLRYAKDGDICRVSGRIIEITYTVPSSISYNASKPSNAFASDVQLSNLVIDASTQYNSEIVTVPFIEILEDGGVEGVKRMKFYADIEVDLLIEYSNEQDIPHTLRIGDQLNACKIMGATPGSPDIEGVFMVVGFGYTKTGTAKTGYDVDVNSVILKNDTYGTFAVSFLRLLKFDEIKSFSSSTKEDLTNAIADAEDCAIINIDHDIDASISVISVTGKTLKLDLHEQTITGGSSTASGLSVENGSLIIDGNGTIVTNDDYDSSHATGVVRGYGDGSIVFNSGKVEAVREDPVNKGQFGIALYDDADLTINGGEIVAGWYCVTGNGFRTTAGSVTTINGGKLVSAVDFAIYQPGPSTLIVNGGEIIGGAGALSANNGTVIINGGTLKTLGTGDTGTWSDGTSGQADAAINLNGKYGPVSLEINGGTFVSEGDANIIVAGTNNPVTISIKGGHFSSKPNDEWIAEGYVCSETADSAGFYNVFPA